MLNKNTNLTQKEICEACGQLNILVRHHWYDTDLSEILPDKTTKGAPKYIAIEGKPLLMYHERMVCLKCNRCLIQNEIRYFKGSSIKPFKYSDDSHIMPRWEIQKAFAEYQYKLSSKYEVLEDKDG
jgi:hypothetical protein